MKQLTHSTIDFFSERFLDLHETNRNLIVLGSNIVEGVDDIYESLKDYIVKGFDANEFEQSDNIGVLAKKGIKIFYTVKSLDTAPSNWIDGISTFFPTINAINGQYGSEEDKLYIKKNRIRKALQTISVLDVCSNFPNCAWAIDIEGGDYEVTTLLLKNKSSNLILCEYALMKCHQKLKIKSLALTMGYRFYCDAENICFYEG